MSIQFDRNFKKNKNNCFKIIRKYPLKTMEFEFTIMFIFISVNSNFVLRFLSDLLELYLELKYYHSHL